MVLQAVQSVGPTFAWLMVRAFVCVKIWKRRSKGKWAYGKRDQAWGASWLSKELIHSPENKSCFARVKTCSVPQDRHQAVQRALPPCVHFLPGPISQYHHIGNQSSTWHLVRTNNHIHTIAPISLGSFQTVSGRPHNSNMLSYSSFLGIVSDYSIV